MNAKAEAIEPVIVMLRQLGLQRRARLVDEEIRWKLPDAATHFYVTSVDSTLAPTGRVKHLEVAVDYFMPPEYEGFRKRPEGYFGGPDEHVLRTSQGIYSRALPRRRSISVVVVGQ